MAGEVADIDHVGGAHGERRGARGQNLIGQQRVAREAWIDTLIVPDAEVHIAAFQQSRLRRASASVSLTCTFGNRAVYRGRNVDKTLSIICGEAATFRRRCLRGGEIHALAQGADLAQDAAAVAERLLGDGGQDETAPDAIEELDAELLRDRVMCRERQAG